MICDFPVMLSPSGVDRLQLLVLGELVAFLGLYAFSFRGTQLVLAACRKRNVGQMAYAAAPAHAKPTAIYRGRPFWNQAALLPCFAAIPC